MPYAFPQDLADEINAHLATGRYANEEDLIRDALEALRKSEELERFRDSVTQSREQADRGEAGPLDIGSVMEQVSKRLSSTG